MNTDICDLCGLPLTYGTVKATISGKTLRFCCNGCRQVYMMLMEQTEAADPDRFRETQIYQRCVEAGIIPGSLEDLKEAQQPGRSKKKAAGNGEAESDTECVDSSNRLALNLRVAGMWCPACAWVIEERLNRTQGVWRPNCLFSMDRVRLEYDPVITSPARIIDMIRKLGYQAALTRDEAGQKTARKAFLRLGVCAFLTMNVMMLSFALYSGFFTELSESAVANLSWPILIMASIVFFYGGAPIHRKAIGGAIAAAPGMETLISIGAASAFGYSVYNWLQGSIHLYFDTASMLITLVLIGKALESWTRDRVQARLGSFFSLQPAKVRICSEKFSQGRYADIQVLAAGDVFRAMTDEAVAADGRVLEGTARVDESSLTGEARPVDKNPGDPVSSGTRLIQGDLKIKATAVGRDSMLGQLTAIMEKALENKTGLEDVTDRVLRYFVPGIVLLALMTGAVCLAFGLSIRESWIRAITVMVISCPCALGVAIPLARVAGISLAGQAGILVHDFSGFERIHQVNAVIFDKTGTLTKGTWDLLDIQIPDGRPVPVILAMAAGLEAFSDHYVGAAIVRHARQAGVEPERAENAGETENGIAGDVGYYHVRIGSAEFLSGPLRAAGISPKQEESKGGRALSEVYMSIDGKLAAVFLFGDSLRESSRLTVAALKERNIKLSIVTGDGEPAAKHVGKTLGVRDCHGGMRPDAKAAFVDSVKSRGYTVAMVGDGVNDVPALASSDLGIAVHSSRQIGREASAITLMGNEPRQILDFYELAGRVTRTIRQNLLFSLIYNTLSIPVAMSGLLNPLVAVTAMMLSSLSVTGNTLRLSMQGAVAPQGHGQAEEGAGLPDAARAAGGHELEQEFIGENDEAFK